MGIVGAASLGSRPFAASKRKRPRFAPPREIAHLQFDFVRWDGPIGPWNEHFGKGRGQVKSLDGTEPPRSCNEIEVAKRLRTVRDHAFWFSGFGTKHVPEIWRPWLHARSELPAWLAELDETIRAKIASKAGGMPDVVAWNDRQSLRSALFVECKGPKESFTEAQEDWVWAALDSGVRLSQIAVSQRPF